MTLCLSERGIFQHNEQNVHSLIRHSKHHCCVYIDDISRVKERNKAFYSSCSKEKLSQRENMC